MEYCNQGVSDEGDIFGRASLSDCIDLVAPCSAMKLVNTTNRLSTAAREPESGFPKIVELTMLKLVLQYTNRPWAM